MSSSLVEVQAQVEALEPPGRLRLRTSIAGGFDGVALGTRARLGAGRIRLETDSRLRVPAVNGGLLDPLVAHQVRGNVRDDLSLLEAEPLRVRGRGPGN
jgi:hypothetical protein